MCVILLNLEIVITPSNTFENFLINVNGEKFHVLIHKLGNIYIYICDIETVTQVKISRFLQNFFVKLIYYKYSFNKNWYESIKIIIMAIYVSFYS